jgi:predicted MFS family arabinose efflux permease
MKTPPVTSIPLAPAAAPVLSPSLIALLAGGAGLAAATLYYSQPLLGVLAADIGASGAAIGWVPTITQLGYAAGLLFLIPLGDRHDRRNLILIKAVLLTLALLVAGWAPGLPALLLASLAIGLSATLIQDLVPAAATLAPPQQRGRVVGMVMTGLLLGILLSRVVSGLVGEQLGWRAVFLGAAASIALLGVAAWRSLPHFAPTVTGSYASLMASLLHLWSQHASLRRAALAQGLLAIGFSAFWSTLAVMLHGEPFRLGTAAAGTFGLAGAAGALAAPLVGRIADRHGPERVTRLGAGLAALSFSAMLLLPWLAPAGQLALIAVSALGFDLGVQASLVAHQSIIYAIAPEARSRLNAVFMVGMFTGMAAGGGLGSLALAAFGWSGVVILAAASALLALGVRMWRA